jgi:Fe-S-cluster containining protein
VPLKKLTYPNIQKQKQKYLELTGGDDIVRFLIEDCAGFAMDDIYNKAAVGEYQTALADLSRNRTKNIALIKSYARYEKIIAVAIAESTLKPACKAGCAYCCYYKVEVKAHEVFAIKDHMQKIFSAAQIEQVLGEAEINARLIATLTQEEHVATNIKCPFLRDNTCSVYSVRPFKCRNFHSTNAHSCEQSYADPSNLAITSGFIEPVALLGNAQSQGFEGAVKNVGLDTTTYDLNTALIEAFTAPAALKRFNKGKKSFLNALTVAENN